MRCLIPSHEIMVLHFGHDACHLKQGEQEPCLEKVYPWTVIVINGLRNNMKPSIKESRAPPYPSGVGIAVDRVAILVMVDLPCSLLDGLGLQSPVLPIVLGLLRETVYGMSWAGRGTLGQ